jgi:hypothetical protein
MFYTIYKITNTVNGKFYIGKHQTEKLDDNYFGSGKLLKVAIKKYGKNKFEKEILYVLSSEQEMNNKEREIITEEFVARSDTYNAGVGGEGGPHFLGKRHTEETKNKISRLGSKHSEETRKKLSEANRKRTLSFETRKKLSEKAKTRTHSEEVRKKISESLKNKKAGRTN